MPATIQTGPDRRQQTYQLIKKLQHERDALWTLYCDFATLKPFAASEPVKKGLMRFSQMLIDYISLGHFGVYERLLEGKERRGNIQAIAVKLYPELEMTTEIAVAFNDKYDATDKIDRFNELERDLSILGENLAKRIDLEDQFCNLMVNSDRRLQMR
ncbi:MAG: Rsd/AlgQ family anti-sigma factor [Methylococcaceae bacterium]|nr:Rsd/AlgQ family anti-sigma factor [Methylococcaceae bacterium]